MQNLKETLESFSLSEDTRRKIMNEDHPFGNQGTPFIPSEFKEINFGVTPTKYNTCIKSYLSNNNTSYTMNYSVKVNFNNT